MTLEEMKALARRLPEEIVTQGDLTIVGELFAPDCRHHGPVACEPGSDGLTSWVTSLRRAFPDLRADVEAEIAEGDLVAQRLKLVGAQEGPLFGRPPTGRCMTTVVIEMVRFDPRGRIVERWSRWDGLGVLRQLALEPCDLEAVR